MPGFSTAAQAAERYPSAFTVAAGKGLMRRLLLLVVVLVWGALYAANAEAAGWNSWPGSCGGDSECDTAAEACLEIAAGHNTTLKDMYPNSGDGYHCVYGYVVGGTIPLIDDTNPSCVGAGAGFTRKDADGTLDACMPETSIRTPGYTIVELPCDTCVGNPITVSNGNKSETVVDFTTGGPNALSFVRYYNSHLQATTGRFSMPLGKKWMSNFDRYLRDNGSSAKRIYRPDGTVIPFTLVGSVWTPPVDLPVKLVQAGSNWEYTDIDDSVDVYDSTFRLTSIRQRNGYTQTLAYDGSGNLASVTDSYGRALTFTFTGKRLTRMVATDGSVYTYTYDKSLVPEQQQTDRLIRVTYPYTAASASGQQP
jgi:YD repeat-containing protein